MAQRVSIKEVAKAAGVSTATVSNVFSGKKPVNDDLAAKVRQVARDLGYQVNKAASLLRSGKNSVVSVLVPDLADPFFTSIIREIENLANDDGFEIIVGNSNDDVARENGRLDALLAWQPSGLVVIPCSDAMPARLEDEDLPPCVLVDRVSQFSVTDTVTINNISAGAKAAKYLAENGHQEILVASSSLSYTPIRERTKGAEDEMVKHGGTVKVVELGSDPNKGAEALGRWLDANPLPSAIFATNDMTTLAVLSCMAHRRIDLPEQISVIGFDDYAWMQARRTGITAIKQPVADIARAVWEQLHARMKGDKAAIINSVHECDLVVRQSVQRLKDAPMRPPTQTRQTVENKTDGTSKVAFLNNKRTQDGRMKS